MARSQTTRFALWRWSAEGDTSGRTDFDFNDAQVEALALLGQAGPSGLRPAAGAAQARQVWHNTDRHTLSYCDGTRWYTLAVLAPDEHSLPPLDATDETLTYAGGDLSRVDYRDQAGVLRARDDLAYAAGDLASVARTFFAEDGTTVITTIVETIGYTAGDVTSVARAVT